MFRTILIGLVGVALVSSTVWAQNGGGAAPGAPPAADNPPPPVRPGPELEGLLDKLSAELNLTAEQKAQIDTVFKTYKQDIENYLKVNAVDPTKPNERPSSTGEDLAKMRAKLIEQIKAVLTDEQKEKFAKLPFAAGRGPASPPVRPVAALRDALAKLNLSNDQKGQIEKLLAELAENASKVDDPAGKLDLLKKAVDTIRTTILTADQAGKLQLPPLPPPGGGPGMGLGGILDRLNLSADQKTRVDKVMADAREQAQADGADRLAIRRAAALKIEKEILTDAQREELKKLRESGGPGGNRGGNHPPPPPPPGQAPPPPPQP